MVDDPQHDVSAPSQWLYRLRPLTGNRGRTAVLDGREAVVGFLATCDLALAERGVSRRHAALRRHGDDYVIEDLGSRNGTYVNGERVEAPVTLRNGDEVRFGPVALRFELVHPADAELAIVADPQPMLDEQCTDRLVEPTSGAADSLTLAHRLLLQLCGEARPDVRRALATVSGFTGAAGAALGEWAGSGEPNILVSAGDLGTNSEDPVLFRFFGDVFARGELAPCFRAVTLADEPAMHCLGFRRPGADLLALVLRGVTCEWSQARMAGEQLLRLLDQTRYRASGRDRRRIQPAAGAAPLPLGVARAVSESMRAVYEQIAQLEGSDVPVLVVGETGVGKEHLVRLIHDGSAQRDGPLVTVNCAAIPADLLEAEMFGIGRGVASGVEARIGRFREAEGGTLFLDEIGELPSPLQAKLLRALATGEIQPVGRPPVRTSARVVAATNADLGLRVNEGRFRADLYYRIAGFELRVPPLRDRQADIPALVEHFLGRFSRQANKRIRGVSMRALADLTSYTWPGNVRQLENEVRRLVLLCEHDQAIESSLLPSHMRSQARTAATATGGVLDLDERIRQLESALIPEALERARGNRARAARMLGLSRNGLVAKMSRLGLDAERS